MEVQLKCMILSDLPVIIDLLGNSTTTNTREFIEFARIGHKV